MEMNERVSLRVYLKLLILLLSVSICACSEQSREHDAYFGTDVLYSNRALAEVRSDVQQRISDLRQTASEKGVSSFKDEEKENKKTTNYEIDFGDGEDGIEGTISFKVHQAENEVLIMIAHDLGVYNNQKQKGLKLFAEKLVKRTYSSFEADTGDNSSPVPRSN